jgi:hypothetical protein
MLKNIIKHVIPSMLLAILVAVPFASTAVSAQTARDEVCRGVGLAAGGSADCTPGNGPSVDSAIATVVNILSFIVGVVAIIMIIIGGLKYITSGGDSNNISSAKNTILYAIIGLVIVVLAQVIVKFVITKVAPQ